MKKFKIEKQFVSEHIAPISEYSPEHNNLLKRVLRIEDGKEVTECLQREKRGYSLEKVEKYDILKAVRFNKIKKTGQELYYVVLDINPTQLTLDDGNQTYREAKTALEDIKNAGEIEEEMLTPLDQEIEPLQEEIEPFTDEETKKPTKPQGRPLPEPTEEDLEIMDFFFKGFSFVEYYLFDRAFVPFLIGRDLEKYPIDFNKSRDYEHIGRNFVHQVGAYPNTYSSLKREDYGAFIRKVKNLDRDKLNILASVIKEQPSFKEFEKETIDRYWKENPDDFRNPKNRLELVETEQALAYIEKNA